VYSPSNHKYFNSKPMAFVLLKHLRHVINDSSNSRRWKTKSFKQLSWSVWIEPARRDLYLWKDIYYFSLRCFMEGVLDAAEPGLL
jgi:hypothetical protein